jgi:hypothetical protein
VAPAPGDVGDDDVEPGAVAEGGVDERAGEIDPAPAGPEHELNQVVTCSSVSTVVVSWGRPALATNTLPGSLIQIASTSGSSKKAYA